MGEMEYPPLLSGKVSRTEINIILFPATASFHRALEHSSNSTTHFSIIFVLVACSLLYIFIVQKK